MGIIQKKVLPPVGRGKVVEDFEVLGDDPSMTMFGLIFQKNQVRSRLVPFKQKRRGSGTKAPVAKQPPNNDEVGRCRCFPWIPKDGKKWKMGRNQFMVVKKNKNR
jgi:hypothetical protein